MVLKTSDNKRNDKFFKAISSVLDRDGFLIDFKGKWFEDYSEYIRWQHLPSEAKFKEKLGSSRFIEISNWNQYKYFDELLLSVNIEDTQAELKMFDVLYNARGSYFPIIRISDFLDSLPENFKVKFNIEKR